MNKVYATMSGGMLITAAAAWAIANLAVTSDPTGATVALREGQYLTGLGEMLYTTPLRWVVMFAPLAFLLFGWGALMRRGSAAAVSFGFFAFAAVMGVSMSSIFLVFTSFSIVQTFLVTAIAFAGLSLWGYTTKRDLSGMGTFLIMGVIGLIVAMVINIFLQSPAMMFAISAIGILIFAGLTAFYTQEIKSDLRRPRRARRPGVAGQGRHRRRAEPLHQLPEHVPVPADVHGATGIAYRHQPIAQDRAGAFPGPVSFPGRGRCHGNFMGKAARSSILPVTRPEGPDHDRHPPRPRAHRPPEMA
jgi:FtsH-binding integral membrane protein